MDISSGRYLVTGGAGFIGSQLCEYVLESGGTVVVADDLTSGRREWVPDGVTFHQCDLTDRAAVSSIVDTDLDGIFHLAARKAVNDAEPRAQFSENTAMTHELLYAATQAGVENVVYTSSSTVYGEAPRPTPEDYAPLEPISVYGASKLADEGLLSTYAYAHGLTIWNFRFANVVGPRLRGAVIPDFIEKLRDDPHRLQILGDGRQEKSYLHVTDCLDAIDHVVEHTPSDSGRLHTFNLGTRTTTAVDTIADIVSDVLDVDPEYEYTGGDRGWTGDVPRMRLSIEKLRALGWEPTYESDEAVRTAATELTKELL